MTEWFPIETAPKDGTRVRLKDDEGNLYRGEFRTPCWWMVAPGARIADGGLFSGDTNPYRAVEWMPLPAPPSAR